MAKREIYLKDWSVTTLNNNPYLAPECVELSLAGFACNHPRLGATRVITSPIIDAKGRRVFTRSGSIYRLGAIAPRYRKWLRRKRPYWDWRNPITIKEL